ncbi:MAG: gliding motility-associated C-terminal domain-containing protein, partial [Bacteroidota bacterium]
NIAQMPGGSGFVTINNICPDPSAAWDNQSGLFLQYDAMTWVFTAWHLVIPFRQYHLKLVIGDAIDQTYDSGVFLEKGSFTAGFDFDIAHVPSFPLSGSKAIEGCNDVAVSFSLTQPAQTELQIDFTIEGTATSGTDYTPIPTSVIIPPGQDSIAVIIHPLPDGIAEGPETVILNISKKTCSGMLLLHDTITILDNSPLSVSAGGEMTLCPGDSVLLVAHVTGGVGPFTFSWNDTLADDSLLMVKPEQPSNTYVVEITDRCRAIVSDTVVVRVEPVALLTNQPVAKTICSGTSTGITLTSNISRAFFSWDPVLVSGTVSGYAAGDGNTIDQVLQLSDTVPGIVSYHIRVTGNGCDTTYTDFLVTVNPSPYVEPGGTVFILPGETTELIAPGGFDSYLWSTGSTTPVIRADRGGTYWVRVENHYGCALSDTILVNEFGLNIPNAFTPNGDGFNDRFRVEGFEQNENVLLQIYNRWGKLIFETHNLDQGWDGTNADGSLITGAYVWIIRFVSGTDHILKGTVTVIL